MAKWKCEVCGNEFENFHAQGFDNKIYCPLCYFKKENQELKLELSGYRQAILEDKDMLGLKEEREELKKQLEEYKLITIDYQELEARNQELKKQLEEYKATNKILSHELTKDKVLQQDCLITCCGIPIGDIPKLITQQKEFIEYMNKTIE